MPVENGSRRMKTQPRYWRPKGFDAVTAAQAKKGTMAYGILSAHNHSGDDERIAAEVRCHGQPPYYLCGHYPDSAGFRLKHSRFRMCSPTATTACAQWGDDVNEDDHRFGLSAARITGRVLLSPIWR